MMLRDPEVYAFNDRGKPEEAMQTEDYEILLKIRTKVATQEEKDKIFHRLQSCSLHGFGKKIAYMGNFIDFSAYLKEYFVEYSYGTIRKLHAFNKTNIRRSFYTNSHILRIVEIKKEKKRK